MREKTVHSEILIHWILKNLVSETITKGAVDKYIERLRDFYANGIEFRIPEKADIVIGVGHKMKIPQRLIICFTELKLSEVDVHTQQYGKLGIGFHKNFLMACGANPVFYVQSKEQGIVNTNLKIIEELKDFLGDEPKNMRAIKGLEVLQSYIKPMEDENGYHYNEMEWRIVYAKYNDTDLPHCFKEKRLIFSPSEVSLLVFPNEDVRKSALVDSELKKKFEEHMPMMVNIDTCASF